MATREEVAAGVYAAAYAAAVRIQENDRHVHSDAIISRAVKIARAAVEDFEALMAGRSPTFR